MGAGKKAAKRGTHTVRNGGGGRPSGGGSRAGRPPQLAFRELIEALLGAVGKPGEPFARWESPPPQVARLRAVIPELELGGLPELRAEIAALSAKPGRTLRERAVRQVARWHLCRLMAGTLALRRHDPEVLEELCEWSRRFDVEDEGYAELQRGLLRALWRMRAALVRSKAAARWVAARQPCWLKDPNWRPLRGAGERLAAFLRGGDDAAVGGARRTRGGLKMDHVLGVFLRRGEIVNPRRSVTDELGAVLRFDHASQERPIDFPGLSGRLAASVERILGAVAGKREHRWSEDGSCGYSERGARKLLDEDEDAATTAAAVLAAVVRVAPPPQYDGNGWGPVNERVQRLFALAAAIGGGVKPRMPVARLAQVCDELSRVGKTTFYVLRFKPWIEVLIAHAPALLKASDAELLGCFRLREAALRDPYGMSESQIAELDSLLGLRGPVGTALGEAWSDRATLEWHAMPEAERESWSAILAHAGRASGSEPSKKWSAEAARLIKEAGEGPVRERLTGWLGCACVPRPAMGGGPVEGKDSAAPLSASGEILRGLTWMLGMLPSASSARTLGALGMRSYQKAPGIGPRAVKVGHAAVYAMGRMPGPDALGQLAMLKVKVKFIPAQKGIEKALTAAAEREGLPREEIEELAVPTYGLTGVGVFEEAMGEFTTRLTVSAVGESELVFVKEGGKVVKSVPAAVKASHAEELKELKAAMKDIAAMLPAQKDRIDGLFLEQKTWTMATWRERYLEHPLTGILGRRLIWVVQDSPKGPGRAVTWLEGRLCDVTGAAAGFNEEAAIVRLWHPLEEAVEGVLAWRRFFEERGIQQPFKQAHREVYVLTDAERATGTYSNRYAAHVIRQHQFHALCAARGWRNKLRLMVDDTFPPASRVLARWGLRAEFWIEGAGDEYGRDTNEAGAFLHLTTDQVRFYAVGPAPAGGGRAGVQTGGQGEEEPMRLDRVPPLVFSEIMRDVDLFVGVASVGNNPEWQDGGPENRYREYWWHYGFGELSGTAQTRRELLERLLPRLRIAGVCGLSERFLTVKGRLREYKIHLGSGNILMAPNDQYLCIVPASRGDAEGIHLPFDGDRVLSIILSKAFMLAEDDRIEDGSILSQIRR